MTDPQPHTHNLRAMIAAHHARAQAAADARAAEETQFLHATEDQPRIEGLHVPLAVDPGEQDASQPEEKLHTSYFAL